MKKILKGGTVINAQGRQLADVLINGEIIEKAAHPTYRPLLREYLAKAKENGGGHIYQSQKLALEFHRALTEEGDMRKANFS